MDEVAASNVKEESVPPPASAPPPAVNSRPRMDTLTELEAGGPAGPWSDGWRPANTDYSAKATAWRAWYALARTERHKNEIHDFRTSLKELRETIDAGKSFVDALVKFLRWAGAILGGAGLLAIAGAIVRWLLALHH